MILCSRLRSASCSSSVGNRSGQDEGSSTSCANSTARHAASGRRAHHRCSVEGCPCRIDFSRAEATLIASSGIETSMSFLRGTARCHAKLSEMYPKGPVRPTRSAVTGPPRESGPQHGPAPSDSRSLTLNTTAVSANPSSRLKNCRT